MTALREIAVQVPPAVSLASLAGHLGLSPLDVRVFQRLHGLDQVVMATGLTYEEQMLRTAGNLAGLTADADRIRYVIAARSDLPISHTRAFPIHDIAAKLGLREDVTCLVIAEHACASGLLSVDLAGRLLRRDGEAGALALVLTGEKAGAPSVQHIPNITIMAEGSAAILVAADGERDQVLSYVARTGHGGVATYQDEYPYVFAEVMTEAVRQAGLAWDDIAVVLPHNVNRVSWVRLARVLDLPLERVYLDNVAAQAHSFSADAFINYVDARAAGQLRPGDPYLMTASGIMTVAAAMVLRH
jgi:3-oxoacyl-[acyl-carrier-protein] synthase-3